MTATIKTELKCDLCGKRTTLDEGTIAVGWVTLTLEHPMVDRDFYDKHVCDKCTVQIIKQTGKAVRDAK